MDFIILMVIFALIFSAIALFNAYRRGEKENIGTIYDEYADGEKYSMAEIEQACSKASKEAADVGINLKLQSEKRQQQFKAREFLDNKTDSKPYYKRNPKPWE